MVRKLFFFPLRKDNAMSEKSEISYMQVRIARMAARKWNLSIAEVGKLFAQHQVFQHIRDCYPVYHVEGDEAVWEDLQAFFRNRGCHYA